jgi:hypothetical protein
LRNGAPFLKKQKGVVLLLTLLFLVTLTSVVFSFLSMVSIQTKAGGYGLADQKAFWLAEAGREKALWELKTPPDEGGKGVHWTTVGAREELGDGSYTIEVRPCNLALASKGVTISASSGSGAGKAIDSNDKTFWESAGFPTQQAPETITVAFPSPLVLNNAHFSVPQNCSAHMPKDYEWQISTDDQTYVTVAEIGDNNALDVTDRFNPAYARYLRLYVKSVRGGTGTVRIATLGAIGDRIISTGTVDDLSRKVSQTVTPDGDTGLVFEEKDWAEIS